MSPWSKRFFRSFTLGLPVGCLPRVVLPLLFPAGLDTDRRLLGRGRERFEDVAGCFEVPAWPFAWPSPWERPDGREEDDEAMGSWSGGSVSG